MVQRRLDGTVDFHRNWSDYNNGFGNLEGEFWLGLEKINRLTKSQSKLRVDLEDFDGNTAYADYKMFLVANESKKYQLSVETYSGKLFEANKSNYLDQVYLADGRAFLRKTQKFVGHSHVCNTKVNALWRTSSAFSETTRNKCLMTFQSCNFFD